MITDIGRSNRSRPRELVAQLGREVAGVEEPRLRVDARLLLERGHVQRAVDEDERARPRRGSASGSQSQKRRERHAEEREDQVGREALEGEEVALADRRAVGDVHHRREQDVVRQHEDDAGDERPRAPTAAGSRAVWPCCSTRCAANHATRQSAV